MLKYKDINVKFLLKYKEINAGFLLKYKDLRILLLQFPIVAKSVLFHISFLQLFRLYFLVCFI